MSSKVKMDFSNRFSVFSEDEDSREAERQERFRSKDLVWRCFNDLINLVEDGYGIQNFKGEVEYYPLLHIRMAKSYSFNLSSLKLAIKNGLLNKNNINFLIEYIKNIQKTYQWQLLVYMMTEFYPRDLLVSYQNENRDSLLQCLLWLDCFDEKSFKTICQVFDGAPKFNFAKKNSKGTTLLYTSVCKLSPDLIDFFCDRGCKFGLLIEVSDPVIEIIRCGYGKCIEKFESKIKDWGHYIPFPKFEKKYFEIVQKCIKRGYKSSDLKREVDRWIRKDLFPDLHEEYLKLLQ